MVEEGFPAAQHQNGAIRPPGLRPRAEVSIGFEWLAGTSMGCDVQDGQASDRDEGLDIMPARASGA